MNEKEIINTIKADNAGNYRCNKTGSYVKFNRSSDNCKFGTLEYVNMSPRDFNNKLNIIEEILSKKTSMRVVMAHVTNKFTVNKLKEKFDVLSVLKIPIGYGNNYQWHVHIRNHHDNDYKRRFEKEGVKNELMTITADDEALEQAFRAGRNDKSYHITSGFKKFKQSKLK